MPLSFASASDNPYWGMAANWNRIFGSAIVNDLLVGYTDASTRSAIRSTCSGSAS